MNELVFEVTQEADGGYCAECPTENIFTQGDSGEQIRRNVIEAVSGYFFDAPTPATVRLHLLHDEGRRVKITRDKSGQPMVVALCRHWGYSRVHQVGSHIIVETSQPSHQRIAVPTIR